MYEASDSQGMGGFLEVECAGRAVAIPVQYVREIHQVPYLQSVPYGKPSLAGILNYRGTPVPAINLESFLGMSPREIEPSDKLLILEYDNKVITVVVAGVHSVLKKSEIERVSVRGASSLLLRENYVTFALEMDDFFATTEQLLEAHRNDIAALEIQERNEEELEVLRDRALALEGSARKRSVSMGRQMAMVRLGNEIYGVDLQNIVEFYETNEVVPVPCTPSHIMGIVSLRGEIITVLDPARATGLKEGLDTGGMQQILVFEQGRELVGVFVREVLELVMVDEAALRAVPTVNTAGSSKYLSEAIKIDDTIHGVFNMVAFLNDPEWIVDTVERVT